jgi:hypothetical protein
MKKILVVSAFLGMFVPALASAELNYNTYDFGYSSTSYDKYQPLRVLIFGFSKSVSGNVYLGGSLGIGRQTVYTNNDNKVNTLSGRAGYHFPLNDKADVIAEGGVLYGTAELNGKSASANGYDFGAGVRALFIPGLEGTLALFHARTSNGIFSNSDTFVKAQFGFNFTPKFQLAAGIDLKTNVTTYMFARFFY